MKPDTKDNPKAVRVVTLGCRLNTLESEMIREVAKNASIEGAIVVNTCAVTAEAERQARQTIRKLGRENPGIPIVVTGCAAQLNPDAFAEIDGVSRVVGNTEKLNGATLFGNNLKGVAVSDIMTAETANARPVNGIEGRTRAFVQIQQGCDHRCTFCIIPFARGPNRSVSQADIINQVKTLVAGGHLEVVLTGVDIMSYGQDTSEVPGLGKLVGTILANVPDLKRLRLSSLDPAVMDETLFEVLASEPRLMPHLHLSLQAADDMVLKRMLRRHLNADASRFIERARAARPDVVFGADLIAGFPTETDEQHENTLRAIQAWGISYFHVFPYSARPGTPAAKMPSVCGDVVRARAHALRHAGEAARDHTFRALSGTEADVLVEETTDGHAFGHSRHFAPVRLAFDAEEGTLVRTRLENADLDHLIGRATA